jgi:hypothetical protein
METFSDSTRAGAWLGAARLLEAQGERIYNLVVEVRQPALATPRSRAIEATVVSGVNYFDRVAPTIMAA